MARKKISAVDFMFGFGVVESVGGQEVANPKERDILIRRQDSDQRGHRSDDHDHS
jgi:hypothetical protein